MHETAVSLLPPFPAGQFILQRAERDIRVRMTTEPSSVKSLLTSLRARQQAEFFSEFVGLVTNAVQEGEAEGYMGDIQIDIPQGNVWVAGLVSTLRQGGVVEEVIQGQTAAGMDYWIESRPLQIEGLFERQVVLRKHNILISHTHQIVGETKRDIITTW